MKFNSLEEATLYFVEYRRVNPAMNTVYPVVARKAVAELRLVGDHSMRTLYEAIGVSLGSITAWCKAYKEGLYTDLTSACAVSRQIKYSHSSAVDHLECLRNETITSYGLAIDELDRRIKLVKELEKEGFTILKQAA